MRLLLKIRNILAEPRLRDVNLENDDRITVHRHILFEKPMLCEVFREFYNLCRKMDEKYFSGEGKRIEIGAGVSFFKSYYPDIITTDVVPSELLDLVLDAHNMDLPDSSVRAMYGINCFHHFYDPDQFFRELQRVLVPGGGCILIEPYHGPLAAEFFKHAFDTEHFDKKADRMDCGDIGVMKGANQALSYIVFRRDLKRFRSEYPDLEIVLQKQLHNYLRYLFSGGLNFRQLLPNFLERVIKIIELFLIPVDHLFALHHLIVIRKKAT